MFETSVQKAGVVQPASKNSFHTDPMASATRSTATKKVSGFSAAVSAVKRPSAPVPNAASHIPKASAASIIIPGFLI
jgi:hypothetical protein